MMNCLTKRSRVFIGVNFDRYNDFKSIFIDVQILDQYQFVSVMKWLCFAHMKLERIVRTA